MVISLLVIRDAMNERFETRLKIDKTNTLRSFWNCLIRTDKSIFVPWNEIKINFLAYIFYFILLWALFINLWSR